MPLSNVCNSANREICNESLVMFADFPLGRIIELISLMMNKLKAFSSNFKYRRI